ncbi:hypothetical protein [Deinococcus hopiensis]|uniref:hypothetical protein n=1 Tax=Deinococcus hopiensis TaxID=309885 RepID=UPI001BAE577A|nr:hypothetical protein [Deinococcus hopiensis]
MTETGLTLGGGRTLRVYDTGMGEASQRLAAFWHHGTPNIGTPRAPLFAAAARLPSQGAALPPPQRTPPGSRTPSAQKSSPWLGHSGGGPHALACAALLPDRVRAAVSAAGRAPYGAEDLERFAEINPSGEASLTAALKGRGAKAQYVAPDPSLGPELFTPTGHAAL